VLVIDDIGAENMTPWSRDEVLSPLLQYRLQQKLPTFFTSNLTIDALKHHFADEGYGRISTFRAERVIDRITAITEYCEIKGENHRQK
jgi:primosomal protein DnaI